MQAYRKPIRRSVLLGCVGSLTLICVFVSLLGHFMLSHSAIQNYRSRLEDVLGYVESAVDADDLRECIRTGEPSERYVELQQFLNGFIDRFELRYLYIVIPQNP